MAVFDRVLGDKPNQLSVTRSEDAPITAEQLLAPCEGERTEAGMRANIRVAVQYIEAWISGNGCVPIYGLMEDAATAEISRTSIWQWIHHQKTLSNGKPVTKALFRRCWPKRCGSSRTNWASTASAAGVLTMPHA